MAGEDFVAGAPPHSWRRMALYRLTITQAPAQALGVATVVALTFTVIPPNCTLCGARYSPLELIVPTLLLPPLIPFTFQTTDVFVVFFTVAVN